MEKRIGLEGSPFSKMAQAIRKHGYNKDTRLEVGEVLAPMPALEIRVGDGELDLDIDDLIVTSTAANAGLRAGDRVLVISDEDTQQYYVIDKVV